MNAKFITSIPMDQHVNKFLAPIKLFAYIIGVVMSANALSMDDEYSQVVALALTEKHEISAQSRFAYQKFDKSPDEFKTPNGLYRCYAAFCFEQLGTFREMIDHWIQEHSLAYEIENGCVCPACEKILANKATLKDHVLCHFDPLRRKYTVLPPTKKTFSYLTFIKIGGLYLCPDADCVDWHKMYSELFAHLAHKHAPEVDTRLICPLLVADATVCGESFLSKKLLIKHFEKHYGVSDKHVCPEDKRSKKQKRQTEEQ